MVQTCSSWKRFFGSRSGDRSEAPLGPSVYEVRRRLTGRVVAFGSAGHIAEALSDLKQTRGVSLFARLFKRQPLGSRAADLEFCTCATGSRAEVRTAAHRMMGLRQSALRRRAAFGLPV